MKFKLGAAIGFAAGYLAASKASDQRRQQVDDAIHRVRENPRVRHVGDVVSRDARRLGDAVEERFARTADSVVDSVAGTVEPGSSDDETGGGAGSSGQSDPARTTRNATSRGSAR